MFGFFKKADAAVDEKKVEDFVDWFLANDDRIIASVENRASNRQSMLSVLDEVEAQLALVYRDGYKGQIEFDYGGSGDEWELNLYHKKALSDPGHGKDRKLFCGQKRPEVESPYWPVNRPVSEATPSP